jgi:hypothetical protein
MQSTLSRRYFVDFDVPRDNVEQFEIMLRSTFGRFAAKSLVASAAASMSPATVASNRAIARILATSAVTAFSVAVADSAVLKTKGEGAAGAAALLGRSQILLSKRRDLTSAKVALADADAAAKATAGSASPLAAQLHRLALVTRARIFNILLDEQESLFANGAAKEADVSTARGLVRAAYEDLVKASPTDSLATLGAAEFELYEGNAQKAHELLAEVECLLAGDAASAESTKVSAAAAIAFRFRSAVNAASTAAGESLGSKLLEQTRTQIVTGKSPISDEDAAALRAELQTESTFSEEELSLFAVVVDAAESRVHPGEFFPLKEGYNVWSSAEATSLHHAVQQFVEGETVTVNNINAIRDAKHSSSFFAGEADLKKVITGSKSGDVLDAIEQAFGNGPATALSSHDVAFQEALSAIDGSKAEDASTILSKLNRQIGFRTTVSKAIALDRLNQPHEALALLDGVIASNEYLYMWKAFLARGRIRQNLGLVADGDADFKTLFSLRSPYAKADIPLRDEHRTKSVF